MLGAYEQIAVQIEAQEGVVEGGEASGDLINVKDVELTPDFERYERDFRRLTLSRDQDLAGRLSATLSFTAEMAGPASGTVDAKIVLHSLIRACGYRVVGDNATATGPYAAASPSQIGKLERIAIGASWTTGTVLNHGTAVTDGTGSGVVVGTYRQGDSHIFVRLTAAAEFDGSTNITGTGFECTQTAAALAGYGFFPIDQPSYYLRGTLTGTLAAGDIVTGGTSGAKGQIIEAAQSNSIIVARMPGFGFFSSGEDVAKDGSNEIGSIQAPVQYDIPSLSLTYYNDGTRIRLKGCRGTMQVTAENGNPGLIRFTFTGVWDSDLPAANLASATDQANPPLYLNAGLSFLDVTGGTRIAPLMNQMQIESGGDVAPREDVTDPNGFAFAGIGGRDPRATFNPEALPEGTFDWWNQARLATLLQVYTDWGTATAGNAWHMRMPGIAFTISQSERAGQRVYDVDGQLSNVVESGSDELTICSY